MDAVGRLVDLVDLVDVVDLVDAVDRVEATMGVRVLNPRGADKVSRMGRMVGGASGTGVGEGAEASGMGQAALHRSEAIVKTAAANAESIRPLP